HADGGARRLDFAEVFGVDLVEAVEVAFHVGEVDGDVEDFFQRAAGVFENRADVLDARAGLHFDVVRSGNLAGDGLARADAGEEEEVADAARVRIGADRLRRALGADDV